ncbi:MAG: polysaccharide ABC transporter ATP-binding protein [Burkholderiales bacterium]
MAQDDICVSVRGVSKKFSRSLKRSFVYGARDIGRLLLGWDGEDALSPSEFWAVRDVRLELPRGSSIGIVGLNGSGKTTLLRMISGVLRPTLGSIHVVGRIAPMLALGAGFKPVLSGRENIFLNLSLLGVAERDIRTRFDSIVDFAELSEAINAPIGTYSSGMLARLGFSCAVHTDPQILIVDEVLSVGDSRFRMKCRNRINELRRGGTSMLLVSHSAILIETLSDQCLFMRKGSVLAQGVPAVVLKAYEEDGVANAVSRNAASAMRQAQRVLESSRHLDVRSVTVGAEGARDSGFWLCGMPGELCVALQCAQALDGLSVNLMIFDLTHQPGETVQFLMSCRDLGRMRLQAGHVEIRLSLPRVGLRPGTYRIKLSVSQGDMHDILDVVDGVRLVVRDAGRADNCLYYQSRDWSCSRGEFSGLPEVSEVPEDIDASEA